MNSNRIVYQRREGQVLLPTLGFLFLTIGMVVSIVALSSNHRKIVTKQVALDQAMYVAEAGLERGCRYVETNVLALAASLTTATSTNINGTVKGSSYSYCITRINSTTFSIVSTGTYSSISRQVSMLRIYQPTYAEFALWSATNGAIYLKDGEVFNGHVHANDALYFSTTSGGPIFHAEVTSGSDHWYSDGATYNGDISSLEFDKGFDLNSYQGQMADVDFNSSASSSLSNIAKTAGLVLLGNSTLTFNGATISISNSKTNWNNHSYTYNNTNGLIYIANNAGATSGTNAGILFITGGSISGRVTVVAENDVYIRGSVIYTTGTNSTSTSAFGLIARDDIHIDTNAPNDLVIDAVMMATGTSSDGSLGSFGVDNYSSGSPRGNLTLFGGIVQNTRGAVGSFNSSTGLTTHGYAKNYSYDPRFISNPPPYYPAVSGQVRFSNWTEGPKQ